MTTTNLMKGKQRTSCFVALIATTVIFNGCMTVRLPKAEIKSGEPSEILTWNHVVEEALKNHPDLKEAQANVQSLARSRDSAIGSYLPSVSGEFDRSRFRTAGGTAPKNSMDMGIQASQPIFTGFQILGDFLQAKRNLAAEEYAYLNTSADVRLRLRSVYVDLLRLEKLLEVSKQISERRQQNAELIRLRYEAGREHVGSLLRSEAIARQAGFEVDQTTRSIETTSLRLGRELGGDFFTRTRVAGDLSTMIPEAPKINPKFSELAEQTPSVRQLIKLAESKKAAVLSAQSAIWPQVNGTYDYGYSGDRSSNLDKHYEVGMSVSAPFFEGGKNVQAIRKATSDYEAARETAKSARDETLVKQSEAWAAFRNALDLVEVRKKFLTAAEERSEIIRSQYTSGLVNFQDFDLAEQDLADSQKAHVEALANALTQEANWEFEKGGTLEEILREQ